MRRRGRTARRDAENWCAAKAAVCRAPEAGAHTADREWVVPELGIGSTCALEEIEAILRALKSRLLSWAEWSGKLSEAQTDYVAQSIAEGTERAER